MLSTCFVRVWMLLSKCRALSLKCLVLVPFTLRGVINVIKHDFSLYHVQVYVCVCGIKRAKIGYWDDRKINEHNRAT